MRSALLASPVAKHTPPMHASTQRPCTPAPSAHAYQQHPAPMHASTTPLHLRPMPAASQGVRNRVHDCPSHQPPPHQRHAAVLLQRSPQLLPQRPPLPHHAPGQCVHHPAAPHLSQGAPQPWQLRLCSRCGCLTGGWMGRMWMSHRYSSTLGRLPSRHMGGCVARTGEAAPSRHVGDRIRQAHIRLH